MSNAGQDCCPRSRLLLERPIYDSFVAELTNRFKDLRLGLPNDEATEIGPLISLNHRQQVRRFSELKTIFIATDV